MGKMKELMVDLMNDHNDFMHLCAQLLQKHDYEILERESLISDRMRADLIVRSSDSQKYIVEVKLYRSERVAASLIRQAAYQLKKYMAASDINRAILIASSQVSTDMSQQLKEEGIYVWDINYIYALTGDDLRLLEAFTEIFSYAEVGVSGTKPLPEPIAAFSERVFDTSSTERGAQLILNLNSTPAGKVGAKVFEDWCEEALKYLFDEEFRHWTRQSKVAKGFHRLDLIARLVPQHSFWIATAQDFKTRYIVFEFKNYKDKLSQSEIYTTEKYLFVKALRSVAIIIARNGADEGAWHAIEGALRENGKVILIITLKELEQMLLHKDYGDDPTDILIQKMNGLLMGLGR